jgi:hypothetical protein
VLFSLPPPEHSPAEARQAADEILSRAEYQWPDPDDDQSLIQDIVDQIAEWIGNLLEPIGIGSGGGSMPAWVGWLVLLALLAVAGLLAYRTRAGWRRTRRDKDEPRDRVVVAAGEDVVDWPAEVARCEAAGLWRDALRARYRVLVGELAERELIGDLVGRTAGELVDEVRQTAPPVAPAFTRATDLFEEAWYGGAAVGPTDRDRFVEAATSALAAAPRDGARAAVPA